MSSAEAPLDPVAAVASFGIAPRPSPEVDRALDATERCLARHGVRRTTMSDIAKEMGVSRPTLYKRLASVEEAIALVAARQLYRLLDEVMALLAQGASPQTFIELAAHTVTFARTHPVTERVLTHEPELVGSIITSGQTASYVDQITHLLAPILEAAMTNGTIRPGDPDITAELLVRLCGSLVLTPTASDLDTLLGAALLPLLEPRPTRTRSKASR